MSYDDRESRERVFSRIAPIIMDFRETCEKFHAEELRDYVIERCPEIAPDSPGRILRELRLRGKLNYRVINRRQSLYQFLIPEEPKEPERTNMRLSFVTIGLYNFKGIVGELTWKFHDHPGLYFVHGENKKEPRLGGNGVGKSTLFVDAPYWILTGKTVLSQRPGALVENWDNGTGTKGVLHIKLDDDDYIIERGRNPSILTLNGTVIQQAEIDKLLPLSDAALRRTLLLGQRGSLFLDLRPEDKSRLFSETLDLDRWLRASDHASDQVKTLDRSLTLLRSDLAGSKARIRDRQNPMSDVIEGQDRVEHRQGKHHHRREEPLGALLGEQDNQRGAGIAEEHAPRVPHED